MTSTGSPGLRGRYVPRTDHINFSTRIPDEFPHMEFAVKAPDQIGPKAVLIEEFVHRFQWAFTQAGVLYRLGCLVQVEHALEMLKCLKDYPSLRLAPPWINRRSGHLAPDLSRHFTAIRAIDCVQRIILGQAAREALSDVNDVSDLNESMAITKGELEKSTGIDLGTFNLYSIEDLYSPDGQPVRHRSTRFLFESHASAYALRLLVESSEKEAHSWIDEYGAVNRIALYRSIEDILDRVPVGPELISDYMAVLRMTDWAISGSFFYVSGLTPPQDYITNSLPSTRYDWGLDSYRKLKHLASSQYPDLAPTACQLAEVTVSVLDERRIGILDLPNVRKETGQLLQRNAWWRFARIDASKSQAGDKFDKFFSWVEREKCLTLVRYGKMIAETAPDTFLFDPSVSQLQQMCRICDHAIIEYPDDMEVFFCEAAEEVEPIYFSKMGLFALLSGVAALLTTDGSGVAPRRKISTLARACGVDITQILDTET